MKGQDRNLLDGGLAAVAATTLREMEVQAERAQRVLERAVVTTEKRLARASDPKQRIGILRALVVDEKVHRAAGAILRATTQGGGRR